MVFRAVQCGEIGPVGLDLGAIGDVEADRAEDFLDALPGAHHRVDAAEAAAAPGQGDVDRLGIQSRLHLRIGQRVAARIQQRLDLFLGLVDHRALRAPRVGVELAEALHLFGNLAGLAEVFGLRVFEGGRILRGGEVRLGSDHELFQ